MSLRHYPHRLLVAATLSRLLVLGLCGTLAVYLSGEQARTAEVLGENIGSRRAASNLEEAVTALLALHRRGAKDVAPLHERVETHLTEIEQFADKEQEREYARKVRSEER